MHIADLHIHSRYSRATSRDGTPECLDLWARRKGITLLGTGDFTHPAWREELKEKLTPAEDGLYMLKEEYRISDPSVPDAMRPRFVVTGEISSIYKKNGKVRKVHSVILLPGLLEAEMVAKKLETIGNLHSDGRPILGLDCRDLLEITLELCPQAIYVPAHVWTPHFSLFGAFSGFDTIEECFEDLTPHIHALETGLSSDPPMNWRLSALDAYRLISNSDAHSPAKLGREANLLDLRELSYEGLYRAIQEGDGLYGTIEFFPEEGKYHFDGHRKCHLCLSPLEAEAYGGKCPVCGRKLTIGVSHRVGQLADRAEGYVLPGAKEYESLVPLLEVIAASTGRSAASVKVQAEYERMVEKLGPEFTILRETPVEDIRKMSGYLVSEGVRRLREGRVERIPGYDGEYGTIRLFNQLEIDNLDGQLSLFSGVEMEKMGARTRQERTEHQRKAGLLAVPGQTETKTQAALETAAALAEAGAESSGRPEELNEEQRLAMTTPSRAIAVIAGPGTGKTKTLVARILYLMKERNVKSTEITAVTFTKKAADEMRGRLKQELGGKRSVGRMNIGTFHSICYELQKRVKEPFEIADEMETIEFAQEMIREFDLNMAPRQFLRRISLRKTKVQEECEQTGPEEDGPQSLESPPESEGSARLQADGLTDEIAAAYQEKLRAAHVLDFDDLLIETLRLLETEQSHEIRKQNFSYLLVDEFQDISPLQYRLIKAWNRKGRELFVIGDPDQAIYSFRGADSGCFDRLSADYPGICTIRLTKNYRSAPSIVNGAISVISGNEGGARVLLPQKDAGLPIRLITVGSEMSEDIFVAKEINRLIGGIDMLDAQERLESPYGPDGRMRIRSFADIAILYRTRRQAELIGNCLQKEGIPYVVTGRDDFLSEPTVRGAVCFFRYLVSPSETLARKRCLKLLWDLEEDCVSAAVFDTMVETYLPKVRREKPGNMLKSWMEDMNLSGDKALQKLLSMMVFFRNMEEFMETIVFGEEGDLKRCGGKSYTSDCVTLLTLHGAKGLEFPVVLLCGARKGVIPLETGKDQTDEAEERRLFYVGMTRAKEELILVTSGEPSPFLKEIPDCETVREKAGKKETGGKQMNLFDFIQ